MIEPVKKRSAGMRYFDCLVYTRAKVDDTMPVSVYILVRITRAETVLSHRCNWALLIKLFNKENNKK